MRTRTADIFLDENGVILVRVDRDARQDIAEARENLAAAIAAGLGKRRPLLTDIRECQPLTPEARRYYSGSILIEKFSAMGLLIDNSAFGTTMANIYLKISSPDIPTKLFIEESKAIEWLKGHR